MALCCKRTHPKKHFGGGSLILRRRFPRPRLKRRVSRFLKPAKEGVAKFRAPYRIIPRSVGAMPMVTKVTMLLTDRDVENANTIHTTTQSRTKAQAVSIALSLARYLIEQRQKGAQLQLKYPDGTVERIVMTELENIAPRPVSIRPVSSDVQNSEPVIRKNVEAV
jgi:hypothetical protein